MSRVLELPPYGSHSVVMYDFFPVLLRLKITGFVRLRMFNRYTFQQYWNYACLCRQYNAR